MNKIQILLGVVTRSLRLPLKEANDRSKMRSIYMALLLRLLFLLLLLFFLFLLLFFFFFFLLLFFFFSNALGCFYFFSCTCFCLFCSFTFIHFSFFLPSLSFLYPGLLPPSPRADALRRNVIFFCVSSTQQKK